MSISSEAVEAVAKALYELQIGQTWGDKPEYAAVWEGYATAALEAAAPFMQSSDPRIDALAAWCGRHYSGYYDEAQDEVMQILRQKP